MKQICNSMNTFVKTMINVRRHVAFENIRTRDVQLEVHIDCYYMMFRNTTRNLGMRAISQKRSLFGWFAQNKMIYPPSPGQITTKNRLYPTYIDHASELDNIILDKDPLILNFTIPGDQKCNEVTQALFDLLGDSQKYPFGRAKPVSMASVACDSTGGKELQIRFAVSSIPSLVVLKKQMVMATHVPSTESKERIMKDLMTFIKSIQ